MGNLHICKLPQASTPNKLAEHQYQHVAPMIHRPVLGPVVALGDYTSELSLREELGNLRENYTPMYISAPIMTRMQRYKFQGSDRVPSSKSAVHKGYLHRI